MRRYRKEEMEKIVRGKPRANLQSSVSSVTSSESFSESPLLSLCLAVRATFHYVFKPGRYLVERFKNILFYGVQRQRNQSYRSICTAVRLFIIDYLLLVYLYLCALYRYKTWPKCHASTLNLVIDITRIPLHYSADI